jgi:hypothetical protein
MAVRTAADLLGESAQPRDAVCMPLLDVLSCVGEPRARIGPQVLASRPIVELEELRIKPCAARSISSGPRAPKRW